MRIPQPLGDKGSLKWIQMLVNNFPFFFNREIFSRINLDSPEIEWLSTLAMDDYAEYRDHGFLEKLGLGKLANQRSHALCGWLYSKGGFLYSRAACELRAVRRQIREHSFATSD